MPNPVGDLIDAVGSKLKERADGAANKAGKAKVRFQVKFQTTEGATASTSRVLTLRRR